MGVALMVMHVTLDVMDIGSSPVLPTKLKGEEMDKDKTNNETRRPDGILVGIEGVWEKEAASDLSGFFATLLQDTGGKKVHVVAVTFPSTTGRVVWSPIWKDKPGELKTELRES